MEKKYHRRNNNFHRKKFQYKLLVLNQYYPPDRSATAGILKKILAVLSNKYDITLITGRPSYQSLKKHKWRFLYSIHENKVEIITVGSTAFPRYSIAKRISNYISYMCISLPISLLRSFDMVFAMTDPPLIGLVGASVAKIKKKPFVYYIQDLHPDMAIAAGMIKNGIFTLLWHKLHMYVLNSASQLIVIGNDMKERILAKGINPEKIDVIRHGTVHQENKENLDQKLIKKIKGKYDFTLIHAGNLGSYGAWKQIIEAMSLLKNENIGFAFIGEGHQKKELRKLSQGIANINFFPFQPREKLSSVLYAGDVQVISIKRGLEGLVVPSKIFPILGAGKPILGICPKSSDTAYIVEKFSCGIIANPDDVYSIADAIMKLYANQEILKEYSNNALRAGEILNQKGELEKLSYEISQCF